MNVFFLRYGVMPPRAIGGYRGEAEDEIPEYTEGAKAGTHRDHGFIRGAPSVRRGMSTDSLFISISHRAFSTDCVSNTL